MTKPTTVLLDLDGTLVDSNDQHAKAWVEVLAEFGHDVSFRDARAAIGKGADHLLRDLLGIEKESREGRAITGRRSTLFKEKYLSTLRPFPRTPDLLVRMHEAGLKLVVATSASDDEMRSLVKIAGGEGLIHEGSTASDAPHSKPDPDIVDAALRKAGCSVREAIMLGDTPYDIAAAGRAGVAAVGFLCGGWGEKDLRGAVAIYQGPRDLLENLEGSPFLPRI